MKSLRAGKCSEYGNVQSRSGSRRVSEPGIQQSRKVTFCSPRTIAEIGRQTLAAIESLHGLGWLHRYGSSSQLPAPDPEQLPLLLSPVPNYLPALCRAIKPHNFHVGLKEVERMIYIVGFDLTRYFKDQGGRIT